MPGKDGQRGTTGSGTGAAQGSAPTSADRAASSDSERPPSHAGGKEVATSPEVPTNDIAKALSEISKAISALPKAMEQLRADMNRRFDERPSTSGSRASRRGKSPFAYNVDDEANDGPRSNDVGGDDNAGDPRPSATSNDVAPPQTSWGPLDTRRRAIGTAPAEEQRPMHSTPLAPSKKTASKKPNAQENDGSASYDDSIDTNAVVERAFNSGRKLPTFKADLPEFHGDKDEIESWLLSIENIIRSQATSYHTDDQEYLVNIALGLLPGKLKGTALNVYNLLTDEEKRQLRCSLSAWRRHYADFFLPPKEDRFYQAMTMKWDPHKETCDSYVRRKLAAIDGSEEQRSELSTKIAALKAGIPDHLVFLMPSHAKPTLKKLLEQAHAIDVTHRGQEAELRRERRDTKKKDFRDASGAHAQLREANKSGSTSNVTDAKGDKSKVYDPSKISTTTDADGNKVRQYTYPNGRTIKLGKSGCHKCGKNHFSFEHDAQTDLIPSLKATVLCESQLSTNMATRWPLPCTDSHGRLDSIISDST